MSIIIGTVLIAGNQNSEETSSSIDLIIKQIRTEQDIKSNDEIDPDSIDELQLEKIGRAVYLELFPNAEKREFIENLIMRESSISLDELYKKIGYKYISEGFKLPINDLSTKPEGSEYHYGYGEVLILITLIIIIILLRIYKHVVQLLKDKETVK